MDEELKETKKDLLENKFTEVKNNLKKFPFTFGKETVGKRNCTFDYRSTRLVSCAFSKDELPKSFTLKIDREPFMEIQEKSDSKLGDCLYSEAIKLLKEKLFIEGVDKETLIFLQEDFSELNEDNRRRC